MATKKTMADEFARHRGGSGSAIEWPRFNFRNLASSMLIYGCAYGILEGAGATLPWYSLACIGILIGYLNPVERP